MFEGFSGSVSTTVNTHVGGSSCAKEDPIWKLAKRHNIQSVVENGAPTCRKVSVRKYRPLPLV